MEHPSPDRILLRFDPHTGELCTEEGRPLKRLHCPRAVRWSQLEEGAAARQRICGQCERTVHDAARMSGAEVAQLLAREPDACLRLVLEHPDILLHPHAPTLVTPRP